MCTLSVAGALPLDIVITSDEKTETLISAFQMLKHVLLDGAFFHRGRETGPQMIMTDNCSELRDALAATWGDCKLFLCVFHILQQVWRWLHEKDHGISKWDRPNMLSLFKKIVYAEDINDVEGFYEALGDSVYGEKYPNFVEYVTTVFEVKEDWALPYRKTYLTRGSHTNNSAEAQFQVFKDLLLQRIKEYNINALFDKFASDLEEHYQNKLLSVASGTFDGYHSRRFKGKGKKNGEHIGFNLPAPEEIKKLEPYLSEVGSNVFTVPSFTTENLLYLVNMTLGVCECSIGTSGSPCKHQYILWSLRKANCPNFIPVFDPLEREKFAFIALGESCEPQMYEGLHDRVLRQTNMSAHPDANNVSINEDVPVDAQQRDIGETSPNVSNLLEEALGCIKKVSEDLKDASKIGDKNLLLGVIKFSKRVGKMTQDKMSQGQLATALHTFACSTFKRKQGVTSTTIRRVQKGKISVQPESVKRRKTKFRGKKLYLKVAKIPECYQ